MFLRLTAIAAAGVSLVTMPATARETGPVFIPAGDISDAPAGFVEMCARNMQWCTAGSTPPQAPRAPVLAAATPMAPAPELPLCGSARFWSTAAIQPLVAISINASTVISAYKALDLSQKNVSSAACSDEAAKGYALQPAESPVQPTPLVWKQDADVQAGSAPLIRESARTFLSERKLLRTINAGVNRTVMQRADIETTGFEEHWDRPNPAAMMGDCEDLAIEKRMRLLDAGFPSSRLFYAVAYLSDYGLHTVLIVRLDDGDYVLDSLAARILPWNKTSYVWLRQQSPDNPMTWSRIGRSAGATGMANAAGPAATATSDATVSPTKG